MDERRDSPRRRTYLGAHVKRPSGSPLGECIVRDLSKTGARLYVAQPIVLPGEIELEITKTGERFRAEVVWSARESFGVRFNPDERGAASPPEATDRTVQGILDAARAESTIDLRLEVPGTSLQRS